MLFDAQLEMYRDFQSSIEMVGRFLRMLEQLERGKKPDHDDLETIHEAMTQFPPLIARLRAKVIDAEMPEHHTLGDEFTQFLVSLQSLATIASRQPDAIASEKTRRAR